MNLSQITDKILNHKFMPGKIWRFHLKLAFLVFVGMLIVISFLLNFFTKHDQTIQVPDFSGKNLKSAEIIIQQNKLRYVVIDSVYTNAFAPGEIVDQDPGPGSRVKTNRRIFFYINATNPEMVRMPNCVGVSFRQAQAIIESNGLTVGNIRYVPDIASNNVLRQRVKGKDIKPGKMIVKGSSVDLVLGKSSDNNFTKIPVLIGLDIINAKKLISESYLNTGAVIYDETILSKSDSTHAIVWKQKPERIGETIGLGEFVDIWVTTNRLKVKK